MDNWIGDVLCRYSFLKHVIGGNIEGRKNVKRRREGVRKLLLEDLKETRGYWKLKEAALDCTLWSTRFEESVDLSKAGRQQKELLLRCCSYMIFCAKKPHYCVCKAKHVGLYDVITVPAT
jgi:hypothetical protein